MQKNMAFQVLECFMVAVHGKNEPSAVEWRAYVETYRKSPITIIGSVVYTEGGSPSAIQRKMLRDALTERGTQGQPAAILTESLIARTAITALNLFLGGTIKAIPPFDIDAALTHIKAPTEQWPQLKQTLALLKRELGLR